MSGIFERGQQMRQQILKVLFSRDVFFYGDHFVVVLPSGGKHVSLVADQGTTHFRLVGRKVEMRHAEWSEGNWQETSCAVRATIRERLAILWRAVLV